MKVSYLIRVRCDADAFHEVTFAMSNFESFVVTFVVCGVAVDDVVETISMWLRPL